MNSVIVFVVLLGFSYGVDQNTTYKTPEYIIPCYKSDPEINKCLRGTFNHLRPYLKTGIEDIEVPSLDPLWIDEIVMDNGRGTFRVRASFHNVTVSGASNYTVGTIKADVVNYNIELGIKLPKIAMRGKYGVSGSVLLFPVRSKGDFWAIFYDVDATAKIYGKEFTDQDNVRFMKVDDMTIDFKLHKSRFRVRDIDYGSIIGQAINRFLNTNADEIIEEMKPAANTAIAKHFKGFLNSAFLRLPLKLWLPDA